MKRLLAGALALFSALTFGATLNPIQLLNPAGSTAGQVISSTGASTPPVWGGVTLSAVTGTLAVNHGGTGVSSASGTALDNITGFASTGFITRTGAGTYGFQSTTNGITLGNLAQAAANTVLANANGSMANVAAFSMPSCSASGNNLQWTSGTGFTCATGYALTGNPLSQFAATTSAQLLGVISDETGTGSLVFGTSPTIGTPTINTPTISGGTINNASVGAITPSTGAFTTLSATGAITPSQTNGIVGTTTNNNANAGSVGEFPAPTNLTAVSLTTNVNANCSSVSLTAGDWDVQGVIVFKTAAGTFINGIFASIGTTSATFGPEGTIVNITFNASASGAPTSGATERLATPVVRVSIASTTTVFLVGQSIFTTSTATCDGYLRARRIR